MQLVEISSYCVAWCQRCSQPIAGGGRFHICRS